MENIVIIGAGPAGISAALYAARGNLNPLVINNGYRSTGKGGEDRELLWPGTASFGQGAL